MKWKPDFQFSQNNLQDYVDCPRRFELRYLLRVQWPALQTEPVLEQEKFLELGTRFHQLVQQDIIGLPRPSLVQQVENTDLEPWWNNYVQSDPLSALPERRLAEFALSTPLAGFRLMAQYDLLAVDPGQRAVIMDWKTSRRKTARPKLQQRLQTRVYPFVLAQAGSQLNAGQPIPPAQIEMVYWFTEFPDKPERFAYSDQKFQEDLQYLSNLITEIVNKKEGQFPLTPDEHKCVYCNYRSLCERGEQAGNWQEAETDPEPDDRPLNLDFEQIGEVGF